MFVEVSTLLASIWYLMIKDDDCYARTVELHLFTWTDAIGDENHWIIKHIKNCNPNPVPNRAMGRNSLDETVGSQDLRPHQDRYPVNYVRQLGKSPHSNWKIFGNKKI